MTRQSIRMLATESFYERITRIVPNFLKFHWRCNETAAIVVAKFESILEMCRDWKLHDIDKN